MSQSTIDPAHLLEMALKLQRCPLPDDASHEDLTAWMLAEFGEEKFPSVEFALRLSEQASKFAKVMK